MKEEEEVKVKLQEVLEKKERCPNQDIQRVIEGKMIKKKKG